MKKIFLVLISLVMILNTFGEPTGAGQTNLQGTIVDKNGQPVIGASIYFPELKTGGITNVDGFYSINELPKRKLLLQISSVGYKMIAETIDLNQITHQDFTMEESVVEISEIAVTGQSVSAQINKMPTPINVISTKDLERTSSTNIIDALSSQPGISQITTGGGISKPVIRGLGFNRVVVVNDGVRQEGQQWGDEHGIEIDENDISKVEILKGPASLLYGSDAMAGVMNMFSAPILPQNTLKLNLLADYQTNNGLINYSVDFGGHKKLFVWDLRYSNKMAHAYQNRYDGYVYNSGFSENALTGLMGLNSWWGYSHLTVSLYHLTPGIVEGNRDPITGQFAKLVALNNNTESEVVASTSDMLSYKQGIPYQQVNHYKAVWNNNILIGDGSLKATIGYQQNRRQEFADILNPNNYGLYFQLHTGNYSVSYDFPETKGYNLSVGLSGMLQKSLNLGTEFLVPEYGLFDIGGFILGKKSFGKLDISGGIRFDNRIEGGNELFVNTSGQKTLSLDPNATKRFSAFSDNFSGLSGSIGASLELTENWITKLNLSRGFRAPNIAELSSNGVHDGTIRYEIGNPQLKPENSLQIDYELGFNTEHVNAKLNLFANNISNFIYSHKLASIAGGDSIQSNFPCYKFDSGNALLWGGEFYIDIHPHPWDWLHFENSFSYVNSQLLNQPDSTRFLPLTPAPKWISDLKTEIKTTGKYLKNTFLTVGIEHDFKQTNVYSAYNTETPTDAYTLLNASIGTDFIWKKHTLFSLFINGTNLTDVAYQSHLSRLKYAPENLKTGRTGVFNMGRNVSLKVIVPVDL
jgi:iron complex outermembrane receptor protein